MVVLPFPGKPSFMPNQRPDWPDAILQYRNGLVYCDLKVDARLKDNAGLAPSGIVLGLVETLMWYSLLLQTGKPCMIRKIHAEILGDIECETSYIVKSEFKGTHGKVFEAEARIEKADGVIISIIRADFKEMKGARLEDVVNSVDYSCVCGEIQALLNDLRKKAPSS